MLKKKMFGLLMVAAVAMLSLGATSAFADTVTAGGTALDVGDRIAGTTSSALLETSIGDIDCDSEFISSVTENPGNSGAGVSASDDAEIAVNPPAGTPDDKLVFTGCTDSIPFITVNSAVIQGSITGTANGDTDVVTLNNITVDVNTTVGTCTYRGNVTGDADEGNQTLVFSDDAVSRIAGSFLCPGSGEFTATYALEAYDSGDSTLSSPLGDLALNG